MKTLLLVFTVFFSVQAFSQNFDEKPCTFVEKQISNNLKKLDVKNNLPSGYSIALDESNKIVAEKSINGKIFDIQYFYINGKLASVIFTQHFDRALDVMNEMSDLKFKDINNMTINNVETTIYSKDSSKFGAILNINYDNRVLTVTISKVK